MSPPPPGATPNAPTPYPAVDAASTTMADTDEEEELEEIPGPRSEVETASEASGFQPAFGRRRFRHKEYTETPQVGQPGSLGGA